MTLKITRVLAGLALSFVAACGAPSAYDLCNESCDAIRKCGYANDVDTANCHTDCDSNKGKYSDQDTQLAKDCKNSGDIRKMQGDCYSNTSCRGSAIEYGLALGSCVSDPQTNSCIKQ